MAKVYVITKGAYSDYHICAVTLDKEKAEKLRKGYIPNNCDDCIEHCNYKWRGVQKEE